MYANMYGYSKGVKRLDAVIRVVNGQLQIDGPLNDRHRAHLQEEFDHFTTKMHGTGDAFLVRLRDVIFGGSSYTTVQLVTED